MLSLLKHRIHSLLSVRSTIYWLTSAVKRNKLTLNSAGISRRIWPFHHPRVKGCGSGLTQSKDFQGLTCAYFSALTATVAAARRPKA